MSKGKTRNKPRGLLDFYSRVDVSDTDGCWLWTGRVSSDGYGHTNRMILGQNLPHRVSYLINVGDLILGMEIDHVRSKGCTSRSCVRPDHLEQVTRAENSFRRRRMYCKRGHELSVVGVYLNRDSYSGKVTHRRCKQCQRDYDRENIKKAKSLRSE